MYKQREKKFPDLAVLGINLAVFTGYVLFGVHAFEWIIIALWHVAACSLIAIIQKRWVWVLAGLLILIIGYATFVKTYHFVF